MMKRFCVNARIPHQAPPGFLAVRFDVWWDGRLDSLDSLCDEIKRKARDEHPRTWYLIEDSSVEIVSMIELWGEGTRNG